MAPYPFDASAVAGMRVRTVINKTDDFTQAGDRYRYFDPARQALLSASQHPHV